MFNKKKQQSLYNSVDDSRSTVYDFTLRSTPIGFESYRTTEYTLNPEWTLSGAQETLPR